MKKINNKKGFTIVELVIVIAVIGVLAAILIPTFINLNNRAKVANTTSFLKNVNTQLAAKEANHDIDDFDDAKYDEKGRFASNYYAKEYAKQRLGYDFDLISPFDGNEICWDENNKKFGLIDYSDEANPVEVYADVKVEEHKWQRLSNDPVQTKGILQRGDSLTLKDNFSKEDLTELGSDYYDPTTETLKVSGTIELGNNPNVKAVEYKNTGAAKDVVIRTNGGTLTVNAPADTVNHYGEAEKVDVVAVAGESYHENGVVKLIAVKKGHVELEGKAEVNGIYVYNESTSEQKDTSFEDIKITVNKGVDVPKFSRSAVEVQPEGTKVCTVVTDQAKDIYLFNEGIYEQIKTVDAGKNVASDASATWADNSAKNTENTQTAAMQLANEWNGTAAPTWAANDTTRELENITNKVEALGVEENATAEQVAAAIEANVEESGKTEEEAAVASALKGTGTKNDPFLIYDYETMQKISDFYNKGYYYFEVAIEKTNNGTIDCSGWVPVKLNGSFNGKNVRFENVDSCLFSYVNSNIEAVTINNFTATMDVFTTNTAALVNSCIGTHDVLIENVNVSGKMVSLYATSGYIGWLSSSATNNTITFKNCINDATLLSSSNTVSGFVYHAYGSKASIIVDNSLVIGTTLSPNASASSGSAFGNVHSITGQGSTTIVKVKYTQEFINNYASYLEKAFATISSKKFVCLNITAGETTISSPNYTYMCDSERNRIVTINQTTNTLPNIGQGFTGVKAAGSSFAVITLNIGPNGYNQSTEKMGTCLLGTYEVEYVDLRNIEVGGTFESKEIKMSHLSLNGSVDNTGNVIDDLNNGWNIVNGQLIYNENEESSWTWIYSQYTTPNQIHTAYVQIAQFDSSTNALSIVRYDLFSNNVIQYTAYTN